ncbi:MAG: D-alanyl-D-alanine carboxypeptidase/D-alanyl-D-alanine-endopeptidase [Bacteroidetes bacterium GWE2_29_8]|nr:MAG: D-alanyl-D-alanine carboxypeptidase/D-alanyl-D-alanine-endopeptidase [Bacteroidetes bacterium GWE2_29_8]
MKYILKPLLKIFAVSFTCLFISIYSFGQYNLKLLEQEVHALKVDKTLSNASWGYCIKAVSSNKVVSEYNSQLSMVPASSLKVLTTIGAFHILGKNYTAETKLEYSGSIDANGTLNGNIYIKGGGDPTLGSAYFGKDMQTVVSIWAKSIIDKGIKRINGQIIQDASVFDEQIADTWIWSDIANYYGAVPSALSISDNTYSIFFKSPPELNVKSEIDRIEPSVDYIRFYNYVNTASPSTGDNVIIYGSPFSNERLLRGTIPSAKGVFKVKGSIPDPPYFCSLLLYDKLKSSGIDIEKQCQKTIDIESSSLDKQRFVLNVQKSPLLKDIIEKTNFKSINFYAETLLRLCGYKTYKLGSNSNGIKAILNYYEKEGIKTNGVSMYDGCGLSPKNMVTPSVFTDVLILASKEDFFDDFYNSLPSPTDASSTLKRILQDYKYAGNLRAKSGYITGVRSYTGYFKNNNGELFAFSIIFNNYTCSNAEIRNKIEQFMKAMMGM